jgi:hypothetical protein
VRISRSLECVRRSLAVCGGSDGAVELENLHEKRRGFKADGFGIEGRQPPVQVQRRVFLNSLN